MSLRFGPKHLIVQTNNTKVKNYLHDIHYQNPNLIVQFGRKQYNLSELVKKYKRKYPVTYYLALGSVAPEIDRFFIKRLIKRFKKAHVKYGLVVNPLQNLLITTDQITNQKTKSIRSSKKHEVFYRNNPYIYLERRRTGHNQQTYLEIKETLDYLPSLNLDNRVVLITGVAGGIGEATLRKFSIKGWTVIGLDYKPKEQCNEAVLAFCHQYHQVDLSQSNIKREIRLIINNLRRLDCIVHIAAIQVCGPIEKLNLTHQDNWDNIINVNVKSIYTISQEALSLLKQTDGNMVVISSVHAFQSSKDISVYAITKSALSGLIRNFAIEWASYNIRVNAVAPGAVKTKMLMDGLSRGGLSPRVQLKRLESRHLMKRVADPHEISEVIYFLGDNDQSSNITGQTIIADGGATILLSTEVE